MMPGWSFFLLSINWTHFTVQLHRCPLQLHIVLLHKFSQHVSGHAFKLLLKYFIVLTLEFITHFNVWACFSGSHCRHSDFCPPPAGIPVFWMPLPSLEVFIIVCVCEAALREHIKRFTLLLPALCSHLCGLLIPRKGQVCSDAVPDSIAHHVVITALCADQLSPVQRGDGTLTTEHQYCNIVFLFFFLMRETILISI